MAPTTEYAPLACDRCGHTRQHRVHDLATRCDLLRVSVRAKVRGRIRARVGVRTRVREG
jgi:hypothetical protein